MPAHLKSIPPDGKLGQLGYSGPENLDVNLYVLI